MKKTVFVLLALFALAPLAALAQTPPAPAPAVDAATAQFLTTLAPQTQAPNDLTPDPLFLQTGCGNGPACPTGELCCFMCGAFPDDGDTSACYSCVTPYKGRCPLVA
jgi:hypothetical protein